MPTEDECIQDKRFFFLHPKANSMSAFRTVEHRSLTRNRPPKDLTGKKKEKKFPSLIHSTENWG